MLRKTTLLSALCSFVWVTALHAQVLPAWITAEGSGTIRFPSAVVAGAYAADSSPAQSGGATFVQNSGSFGNWFMEKTGTFDSVPSGSSLDMTYDSSYSVSMSVLSADTLQIGIGGGFNVTGPSCGEGDDRVTETRHFSITAQSNVTLEVSASGIGSSTPDFGFGGISIVSSDSDFLENGVPHPTIDNTISLVAGNVYDFYNTITFDVHENDCGFDDAGYSEGFSTTTQYTVVPEPAMASMLVLGGLIAIRRRR